MTIKKRIVIWYTLWMSALAVLMVVLIISGSGYLMSRQAIADLEEEVNDSAAELFRRSGRIDTDELDEFDDGVYIQVYDGDGRLVFGLDMEDFPPFSARQVQRGRSGQWYVYSAQRGDYTIRGLISAASTYTYLGSLELMSLVLLPVLIVLAALGGYLIVRRSFRPADQAIRKANDIAGSSDPSLRIDLGSGKDEIHEMASAFDRLLDRLEDSFRRQQQFTSDASHELRTPLSIILAECEYALGHRDDNSLLTEALESVQRQGGRMNRLVGQLLTLARSDGGRLAVSISSFDLGQLTELIVESLEDGARQKEIEITSDSDAELIVESDQDLVTRIIVNYITNAIQYTGEGGHIRVEARRNGEQATVSVADDGIGIAKEDLDRIWDRFFQVDGARNRSSDSSSGLGLAMVRAMAGALGGSCAVTSEPGAGSVFSFSIPVRARD